jgi:hypothetical protein
MFTTVPRVEAILEKLYYYELAIYLNALPKNSNTTPKERIGFLKN